MNKLGNSEPEPEPEPEPKERTKTVLKLTGGLELTDADIEGSEGIDWNEQRAARTRQELWGRLLDVRKF